MKRFTQLLMAGLLLVPLAACDEEGNLIIPVTGTISGTVSAGGGVANVTVTLTGPITTSRTTDANGGFTIPDLQTGSYVVSISDIPPGVAFSTTSRAVTITDDNPNGTADFNGSVISSGVIVATVRAGDDPVANVTVTLSGAASQVKATDASGQVTFDGLPTGDFTVTISNTPSNTTFGTTSVDVDGLGVNEQRVAEFTGVVDSSILTANVRARNTPVPGVTVTIAGPESGQKVTDASGNAEFSGLKAGVYTVTISNWPANTSFTTTQLVKTLEVGEAETAEFNGDRDLTATVAIESVTMADGVTPSDPNAMTGIVNVHVDVDEEQDNASALRVRFGGVLIGEHLFTAPSPDFVGPEPIGGSFDFVFTFNSAEWDTATGLPTWLNWPQSLVAELETLEGGVGADLSSQVHTPANSDFLATSVSPAASVLDAGGKLWIRDFTATTTPVIYSATSATTQDPSAFPASLTHTLNGTLNAGDFPLPAFCATGVEVAFCDPDGPFAPLAPAFHPGITSTVLAAAPAAGITWASSFSVAGGTPGVGGGLATVNTGWCPPGGCAVAPYLGLGPADGFPGAQLVSGGLTVGGQPFAMATTFSFGALQSGTSQANGFMNIDGEAPAAGAFILGSHANPSSLSPSVLSILPIPFPPSEPGFAREGWAAASHVPSGGHTGFSDNPSGLIPNITGGFPGAFGGAGLLGTAPAFTAARTYYVNGAGGSCSGSGASGPVGASLSTIVGGLADPLMQTDDNDDVDVEVIVTDVFGNATCVFMSTPGHLETLGGPTNDIGVDQTGPDWTGGSIDPAPYNPPGAGADPYTVSATDAGNGFSGLAGIRTWLRRKAAGGAVAANSSVTQQENPIAGPFQGTLSINPPVTGGPSGFADAYYDFNSTAWDRATNSITDTSPEFIVDGAAPNLFNPDIDVPGPYGSGSTRTWMIDATDNVDIRLVDHAYTFDATTEPTVAGEANAAALMHLPLFEWDAGTGSGGAGSAAISGASTAFGSAAITTTATFAHTSRLIRSWEMLEGGAAAGALPVADGLVTAGFRPLASVAAGGALIPTTDVQWRVFDHSGPITMAPGAPGVGAFFDTQTSAGTLLPAWIPAGSSATTGSVSSSVNEAGFNTASLSDPDFEIRGSSGVFISPYTPADVHYLVTYASDPGVYYYVGTATSVTTNDTGAGPDGRAHIFESPPIPSGAGAVTAIVVVAVDSAGDALFTGLPL